MNKKELRQEGKCSVLNELKKKCRLFSKLFSPRILPTLPEEYDRYYIVESSKIDCSLLKRSGYTVVHRPYFAMGNSTHGKWQLNPHTKRGVDAALNEDIAISYEEYLELFEEK